MSAAHRATVLAAASQPNSQKMGKLMPTPEFDSYEMQILVLVAKNCRPNSPVPERAWWKPTPVYGLAEFGDALSRLTRDGFLKRKHGYRVKPSDEGYKLLDQWRAHRCALKERPALYDPIVWEQPRISDIRYA